MTSTMRSRRMFRVRAALALATAAAAASATIPCPEPVTADPHSREEAPERDPLYAVRQRLFALKNPFTGRSPGSSHSYREDADDDSHSQQQSQSPQTCLLNRDLGGNNPDSGVCFYSPRDVRHPVLDFHQVSFEGSDYGEDEWRLNRYLMEAPSSAGSDSSDSDPDSDPEHLDFFRCSQTGAVGCEYSSANTVMRRARLQEAQEEDFAAALEGKANSTAESATSSWSSFNLDGWLLRGREAVGGHRVPPRKAPRPPRSSRPRFHKVPKGIGWLSDGRGGDTSVFL